MWFYNKVIVPVYNGIVWVFSKIANFFIGLYNKVASVLNSINILGWRPFHIGKKSEIDYDAEKLSELSNDSDSSSSDSDSSSGGNIDNATSALLFHHPGNFQAQKKRTL